MKEMLNDALSKLSLSDGDILLVNVDRWVGSDPYNDILNTLREIGDARQELQPARRIMVFFVHGAVAKVTLAEMNEFGWRWKMPEEEG